MRLFELESYISQVAGRRDLDTQFCSQLQALMEGLFLDDNSHPCHSIESRPKELMSVREKIQRKGYTHPDSQMTDLIGLRVIMYYDAHVDYVVEVLRREFNVDESHTVDKRSAGPGRPEGYRSFHVVAQLDSDRVKLTEWSQNADRYFEIQVRSILAHAWAAIDHSLEYKRAGGASEKGKEILALIASNLREADEQFNELRVVEDLTRVREGESSAPRVRWWDSHV